jgi:hypothetical protein
LTTDEQTADESQVILRPYYFVFGGAKKNVIFINLSFLQEDEGKGRTPTRRSLRRQAAGPSKITTSAPGPSKSSADSNSEAPGPAAKRRRAAPGSRQPEAPTAGGPGSRPVRQRRLPAGLQDSHVESPNKAAPARKGRAGARAEKQQEAEEVGSGDREEEEAGQVNQEEGEGDVEGDQVMLAFFSEQKATACLFYPGFRIWIRRIRMFLGLLVPDPSSSSKNTKIGRKSLIPTVF